MQQDATGELSGSFRVPVSIPAVGPLPPGPYALALAAFIPGARPATPVLGVTVSPFGRNGVVVVLAGTPFTVTAAPSWASLGALTPLWFQKSARLDRGPVLVGDPTAPRRLAVCTASGMHISSDGGISWRMIPTDGAVQAIAPTPFQLVRHGGLPTGGRTRSVGRMSCLSRGPCVRWGPAPSAIGGQGVGYTLPIEVSSDGGQTWVTATWPEPVILNQGPSELVALSATDVALISGFSTYPLVISHDGGRSWEAIALPGLGPASESRNQYPDLQMLPNGSLLTRSGDRGVGWLMLTPGARQWCEATVASPPASVTTFWATGERL